MVEQVRTMEVPILVLVVVEVLVLSVQMVIPLVEVVTEVLVQPHQSQVQV
tara:strand:+ start:146 stop:295 length:150 start_codon:yes stop_codon:yes gene_type:complete